MEGGGISDTRLRVRHARRGSIEEEISLDEFLTRCEAYFAGDGRMIDQPYQARLPDGMIRCYLVRDRVAGFGEQLINALFPAPDGRGADGRTAAGTASLLSADPSGLPGAQSQRWKQNGCRPCAAHSQLDAASLPVIWDADFLYGPKTSTGADTYVLCEINVSSVYPFPDEALAPLAQETLARLEARHH